MIIDTLEIMWKICKVMPIPFGNSGFYFAAKELGQ